MCIIPRKKTKKNILVLSYFNLGDVICDTPSLRAIKKQWPEASIHVLMRRPVGVEMISKCPYVDTAEVIVSDLDSWVVYIKQLLRLRKMNFEVSFQLVRAFNQYRKTNIPFIIGVPQRFGLVDPHNEKLYKHCFTKYAYSKGRSSRKEESIKVVQLSGIKVLDLRTECWIPEDYDEKYRKSKKNYIIIHPGASLEYKRWPKEEFVALVNYIENQYGYLIYVTGVNAERELLNFIKSCVSTNVRFMIDLPIGEFWALLKYSALVITNDTGTLHFALALNCRVISLFGPTIPDYAVGEDVPISCIIIRGTTHMCDLHNCRIYMQATEKRRKEIFHLCRNENTVCVDMISFEIVRYFVDEILTNGLDFIRCIHNLQGFNPFKKQ